ncbi:NAD(P)H-dependent glycerol-3-phosphate dehydrogenase [Pseudoflavonifractor phocaeensis]|uniref:NAD(P)H-dependent glycerol-3-phosphate dehydrogenase n=1 Tax=Pseudoflavonifractor phocaeensis TaxID=1870988 RepID=UPI001F48F9D6|nr:NAD(P)H-dependent glycerol-3-phosphate dehydrogenase [Pseudoflavonifractor phocaeensis]MCF2661766.1 NAD(P)-dependent glycerol-3-phosphate dehydrogenase [Pseudoflavonifractor phocaeensis]
MKITVVGSGGWGTALALLLLENGHEVTIWSHRPEKTALLRERRENPMLPGVPLPEAMNYTSDLAGAADSGAVLMATPSYAVRETTRQLGAYLTPGTIVISASKGIEKDSSLRLSQVIEEELGGKCPVVVLSGPSHAEEVGRHIPTGVVAAADDLAMAGQVQDLFMNPRFRVYTSDDRVGTEICAAMKNVIALCAGCCDGLGCGDNTKALLMTRGMAEIARLGVALGGRKETFTGLAGMGDLIVTCCSMHSRNRRCGILIGQGKPIQVALEEIGAVVEGYYAAANARTLAQKAGVEMPISQAAYEVLYEGREVRGVVSHLMGREKRSELEESWS